MSSPALSTRVIRGLFWTGSPFVLQILVGILFYVFLKPEDMGQFEYALVIVMLLGLISSLGLGEALVQDRTVTDSHFSSAFWVALSCGLAITGFVFWSTPAAVTRFSFLFENPVQFEWILSTLSLLVPFAAVSGIFRARLQRDLRFRAMAVSEVFGVIVFAAAAILLLPSQGIRSPVVSAVIREAGLCMSLWVSVPVAAEVCPEYEGRARTRFVRLAVHRVAFVSTISTAIWPVFSCSQCLVRRRWDILASPTG